MTNREAFNSWLRMKLEKQIDVFEGMSNEDFVRHIMKYPGTEIHANIMEYYSAYRYTLSNECARINSIEREVQWLVEKLKGEDK